MLTVAVWLDFNVAICKSCRVLATMLPLEGCTDVDLWEETSPTLADVQSMAKFLSEPKLLPLGVCIGRLSQPRLVSRFCAEMSKLYFGVGVDVGGKRTVPWLFWVTGTSSVDAEAGGCVEAVCLSLESGVVGRVFFKGSVCCRSFRCSLLSSSFFFCWSCC